MSFSALQIVQRVLVTAVAVVLALTIGVAFMRILSPPDPDVVRRNQANLAAPTSSAAIAGDGLPALTTEATATTSDGTATTTTVSVTVPPGDPGDCPEPPSPGGPGTTLLVYYTCGQSAVPTAASFVYRTVPTTQLVLTSTLEEMVKGPTAEEVELGFNSLFSSATANSFSGVSLGSGQATVDFNGLAGVPGISDPEQNIFFLADLNATVFQFDSVDSVQYRLNGSCDDFWELLGGDECRTISRGEWNNQLSDWRRGG